jgi:hypothetical protein
MSKIALEPNVAGTGTFSIASPATNTNRTLTLPDADGALLTAADLPSGGATLLGTIATTSGTSVTLSGLDLTGYRQLVCAFDGVSGDQTAVTRMQLNGANLGLIRLSSPADYFTGLAFIDLSSGIFACSGNTFATTEVGGYFQGGGGPSGLTTASTSITFTVPTGNFDAGSITIYGVA